MQPSAGVGQHSESLISEAAKPVGGGMLRSHSSSDTSPYAKRDSVFRRKESGSPVVKGGSQSRTTVAEGTDLHKRGTSAEGWEEAANGRLSPSLAGGGCTPIRFAKGWHRRCLLLAGRLSHTRA